MAYNPYNRYAQQSVMTMTNGEMLVKLYEGMIKNMNLALAAIDEHDVKGCNEALKKAQKIINYLIVTLDRNYPISNNLASLYDFFNHQLIAANTKKDPAPIREILPMVADLRDTFAECDRIARASSHHAAVSQGMRLSG